MTLKFGEAERKAAARLIDLAVAEDLRADGDLTCQALINEQERGAIEVTAREPGVLAGGPVAEMVCERFDAGIRWEQRLPDGSPLEAGTVLAVASGPLRSLLTAERTALNFLTHLSGVATLTRRYVEAVSGTEAKIFDTRKTLPGYRVLEKYAVRAGGGHNHRMGLFDGVLIKDNHLAAWAESAMDSAPDNSSVRGTPHTIPAAIEQARQNVPDNLPIEVEVDTLEQLADALSARPDIVLLDNMDCPALRQAVELRDRSAPGVQLEASGGVTLETVAEIAHTGVDRISVGALTHSAPAFDIGFDWSGRRAASSREEQR